MKPDKEKELEKLMNGAGENKDLFNDLYGDLFGGNSTKPAGGSEDKPGKPGNSIKPEEISFSSRTKVWWICPNGRRNI